MVKGIPSGHHRGVTAIDGAVFLAVFGVVFLAELPDKTALAALVLATHYPALPVFVGAGLALTVQSAVAVSAGSLFSLLPVKAVHIGAGLLFLVSAVFMWRRKAEGVEHWHARAPGDSRFFRELGMTFGIVFIAEWGDLTQIGTAGLAAHYRQPLTVFLGATAALWAVTALSVALGNRAARLLDPTLTKRVAAVAFALVGVALLSGLL